MSRSTIDINADLGESRERLADGSDAELMRYITSASVACGGHAGDALTMEQTLELARENHVSVGAHPSYPDRPDFGRKVLQMAISELQQSITDQLNQLLTIANRLKIPVIHVKPHGALYHSCNSDGDIARALCRAVLAVNPRLIVIGQAGSPCLRTYREMNLPAAAEAFADRAYEPDGTLRNRKLPGALLSSPDRASAQAIALATRGKVLTTSSSELAVAADTLCIHSDTPDAALIARAIKEGLAAAGVSIRPF
jgi:UPF0271 protein